MTAASQLPAAAWRPKPERIALLEKLGLRISGVAESSGEAAGAVKTPAMHPGANGHPTAQHPAWSGEGRGSGSGVPATEEAWRMRPGRL